MDTNFIIAQIFGGLSIVSSVCSMQFKKRSSILIALLCLSVFSALNMIFLGSFSAAYITLFAILEMFINYLFERKGKTTPKYIVGLYILGNIALGILTFEKTLDILPIAAAVIFCFTLLAKNEQNIRKLMFCNQILWLIFDISVGAYVLVGSNVFTLISTAIAYVRYGKAKNKKSDNKTRSKTKGKAKRK